MLATAGSLQSDGTVETIQPRTGVIQGIDNPTCRSSSSTQHMWPLAAVTRAAVGLPASVVPPLVIQQ
jgi:hypothetical protein